METLETTSAWDIARARYKAAEEAMAADGHFDVLEFIDAETSILDTPTPDLQAFRWKVERMHEIAEHSVIEQKDFDRLLADLAQLAREA